MEVFGGTVEMHFDPSVHDYTVYIPRIPEQNNTVGYCRVTKQSNKVYMYNLKVYK